MDTYIGQVLTKFAIPGKPVSAERYGHGHINETYLVKTDLDKSYILQKVNTTVFKNIDALMSNLEAITSYLSEQTDDERRIMRLVKTAEGAPYLQHTDGTAWRVFVFVENSICLQKPECPEDFYQSAVAFGQFQHMLRDFPAHTLQETIPNFHNTPDRYRIFREVLAKDPLGRAKDVQPEIEFALAREKEAGTLVELLEAGKLPLRVTHNDTKLNNVMLDATTRKALCVVDLDTVMPGLSLYDYGDAIRAGAATGDEDDKNLAGVEMSLELFEAYTRGFLFACPDLTSLEIEMMPVGAKTIALELGLRFLTDYIDGDHYFANRRPGQNLDRCRTQFKLVQDMESKWDQMHAIVKSIVEQR